MGVDERRRQSEHPGGQRVAPIEVETPTRSTRPDVIDRAKPSGGVIAGWSTVAGPPIGELRATLAA
jgi:hypothetical protein